MTERVSLLLTVAFLWTAAGAAVVDVEAARASAAGFLQARAAGPLMSPGSELRLVYTEKSVFGDDMTDYYVFEAGGGFVIVAGDDRAERVLGYGEITIADLNALVDVIAVGNMNADHDLNGDGEVNIADINALIDLILSK